MIDMINQAASQLSDRARIHLVGRNRADLYGGKDELNPMIIDHGPQPEKRVWDFIRQADLGLALATSRLVFDNDIAKIYSYLRGGLPVLSEEPIIQNSLVLKTGLGAVFKHGDLDDLVRQAVALLEKPGAVKREEVMKHMAQYHSWDRRVETYIDLFKQVIGI
jgi:hypothetical protein